MEKIKNLPAMRLAAFAVAVAIILGLSSVMFSFNASAEIADDVVSQLGTLANYDCVKYKAGQHITFEFLRSIYNRFNSPYVCGVVLGYKDGKFVSISKASTRVILGSRSSTDTSLLFSYCTSNLYESEYPDKYDVYYHYFTTYNDTGKYGASSFRSKNGKGGNGGFIVLADSYSDYVNRFGDTCYFVYTTSSTKWSDSQFQTLEKDIIDNLNDSNYKDFTPPPTGGSENGRFICFGNYKEYTYDAHLADISAGAVYQRNDYLSSEQTNYTAFMFDDTSCFNWADQRVTSGHIVMYSSTSIAFNYYNSSDSVGAVKLRVSKTQMLPSLRESDNPFDVTHYFVMKPANKHFSRYVIISEGSLRSVPANSTATFRVNMQGYCDMNFNSYYLLEIVDVQSDTVVSSAMFVYTGKDSGKIDLGGPFGNGSNHKNDNFISVDYEYKEGNNVDDGILTPDQDGTLPNLPNGIKDETYIPSGNYNLSNLDISDIFSSLNQATASVGAFFQATLNIIPITIMTLILGSLALLIVLRILGR